MRKKGLLEISPRRQNDIGALALKARPDQVPAVGVDGRKTQSAMDADLKGAPLICMRTKPAVKARMQAAAEADGYHALTTWLRHLAIARADQLGVPPEE